MYSIGEFSRISGFSIKALRLYHDKGLLIPSVVDSSTGYRYYDHKNIEQARIINYLRELEFSLAQIDQMLEVDDEADAISFFEKRLKETKSKIQTQKGIIRSLELILSKEKEAVMSLRNNEFEVEEKELDTILIAGIRFKGKYNEVGERYGKIAKKMGRHINGKALGLYYDSEYKEENADIEACFPIRKGNDVEDIKVHELAGGKAITLIHKGPYENLGRSYEKIFAYINDKRYEPTVPSREIYIKGPGMIFKGNLDNYLTEIQILI